jgi:signal transduction histidine kinase
MAYQIVVDKHGGQLQFDSKEGEGTTFTVKIPKD